MTIFKIGIFITIFDAFIFFKLFENKNKSVTKWSIFKQCLSKTKYALFLIILGTRNTMLIAYDYESFNTTNALNHF